MGNSHSTTSLRVLIPAFKSSKKGKKAGNCKPAQSTKSLPPVCSGCEGGEAHCHSTDTACTCKRVILQLSDQFKIHTEDNISDGSIPKPHRLRSDSPNPLQAALGSMAAHPSQLSLSEAPLSDKYIEPPAPNYAIDCNVNCDGQLLCAALTPVKAHKLPRSLCRNQSTTGPRQSYSSSYSFDSATSDVGLARFASTSSSTVCSSYTSQSSLACFSLADSDSRTTGTGQPGRSIVTEVTGGAINTTVHNIWTNITDSSDHSFTHSSKVAYMQASAASDHGLHRDEPTGLSVNLSGTSMANKPQDVYTCTPPAQHALTNHQGTSMVELEAHQLSALGGGVFGDVTMGFRNTSCHTCDSPTRSVSGTDVTLMGSTSATDMTLTGSTSATGMTLTGRPSAEACKLTVSVYAASSTLQPCASAGLQQSTLHDTPLEAVDEGCQPAYGQHTGSRCSSNMAVSMECSNIILGISYASLKPSVNTPTTLAFLNSKTCTNSSSLGHRLTNSATMGRINTLATQLSEPIASLSAADRGSAPAGRLSSYLAYQGTLPPVAVGSAFSRCISLPSSARAQVASQYAHKPAPAEVLKEMLLQLSHSESLTTKLSHPQPPTSNQGVCLQDGILTLHRKCKAARLHQERIAPEEIKCDHVQSACFSGKWRAGISMHQVHLHSLPGATPIRASDGSSAATDNHGSSRCSHMSTSNADSDSDIYDDDDDDDLFSLPQPPINVAGEISGRGVTYSPMSRGSPRACALVTAVRSHPV